MRAFYRVRVKPGQEEAFPLVQSPSKDKRQPSSRSSRACRRTSPTFPFSFPSTPGGAKA